MKLSDFFKVVQKGMALKLETWNIPRSLMSAELRLVTPQGRYRVSDAGLINGDPTVLLLVGDVEEDE